MTPLTPQITAKASGDKKRTSVYLRKPGPLRKLQHTHTDRLVYVIEALHLHTL